ncbi:hypothetical protein CDD80_2109 [Ophiocordyceps camponoti-rufipedis]|uniref:AAA+ ATPase domain-containing protein n=1 Tax=Ophiocordyceps camponoti-rufipedis TaxID=2004952 RepID=A0A2C5ZNY3_9HYPO|nr:hypothetical protein CDD80_2109 [Ophiocordyceps camponoti-rufipedis]
MLAAAAPLPLWHTAIVVTRAYLTATRRALHASSNRRRNEGAGGKPTEDSEAHQEGDTGPQAGTEILGGRLRSQGTGFFRARQTRKHIAAALPAVQLPASFLEERVTIHSGEMTLKLPAALAEDAEHVKISRLFSARRTGQVQPYYALAEYFTTALDLLRILFRQNLYTSITPESITPKGIIMLSDRDVYRMHKKLLQINSMIIDAAYHLTDSLYPCRQAEYTYTARPFWWWDIYDDANRKDHDQEVRTSYILNQAATSVDYSLADALADCPIEALLFLTNAVYNDLHTPPPPPNLNPKAIKRPAPVLVLSGYGGKAIAESIGQQVARRTSANLIQLDAYNLSVLVGDYLGQNWAYSRGPVSMLGFRAAELGGRLTLDSEETTTGGRQDNVEDSDAEPLVSGFRTLSAATLEELEKIRQGTSAVFTKWESLKIDKVLEHIIHTADSKDPSEPPRRVLIHVHDIVELSMTLEGSVIISKIRALVDSAWQQGVKIAFLGTSSCEQPTEGYESAVRDFLVDDLVITRRIQPDRADKKVAPEFNHPTFNLQKADYVAENLDNVRRMLAAMNPGPPSRLTRAGLELLKRDFLTRQSSDATSHGPILSASEVHYIASTIQRGGLESPPIFHLMARSPLRQQLVQRDQMEQFPKDKIEATEKAMPDTRQTRKYNEYEKRISVGHIDRKSIKTTFADVHAPTETKSTLKLLTTLALVRPEAFSYGVLAQDRIPGCLLYGPPGTGKTMLAKAVAKESGANMLEISGALVNDKWVGESEKLIRAVFTLAKRISPCVVFIDEADALLGSRSSWGGRGAHREFINQFLKEWDGMEETSAFIMVATNRPLDLDDAVLRRLPRRILVDLPLRDDRAAILRLLLKSETLDSSVSIDDYADRTAYYSGSDLKNVCVAAAMAAVQEENDQAAQHKGPGPYVYPERRTLTKAHFEKALGQISASISEDMASLKQIRRFDREYGDGNNGGRKRRTIGFGDFGKGRESMDEVRVRPSKNP